MELIFRCKSENYRTLIYYFDSMPVFELPDEYVFPHPSLANPDGLLAVGGDLSVERLLLAYANGIFPWYVEGSDILWWSPNPRMVLFPDDLKVSASLKQTLRSGQYSVTFDQVFSQVIAQCALVKRAGQEGTWIVPEMRQAYIALHEAGFAHSVETWHGDRLVGGLYGVSLGRIFFGESMFHLRRDASKVALYHLVQRVKAWDFLLIDVQQETGHMQRLGARLINLETFLEILKKSLEFPTIKGNWC